MRSRFIRPSGRLGVARRAAGLTFRLRSVFGAGLRGSSGIFWIQPGRGHDGASQFFGGDDKSFGWHLATGIFFGGGRNEAIAPANYGLKVLRLASIVRQGTADLADGGINSLFDVDEHIFAPQLAGDLLARNQLAPLLDQKHEQLQRQALQANWVATAAELKASVIQLEIVEANLLLLHSATPTPLAPTRAVSLQIRRGKRRLYGFRNSVPLAL